MPTKDLADATDDELLRELARRRAGRAPESMTGLEDLAEEDGRRTASAVVEEVLLTRAANEDGRAKRCPRCGVRCRVRRKNCPRTIRTTTGEHRLTRNYHHCEACKAGFFPLDIELGLPDEGEVSVKMQARILDMGLNAPFGEAAARWTIHHSEPISDNLVRCVVDRAGQVLVDAAPDVVARAASTCATVPETVVIEVDGSMLPMRGPDPWREVKVAVVYRQEARVDVKGRGVLQRARYIATLESVDRLRAMLTSALVAERAYDAKQIVVIADGAPWIWNLADEVAPDALQVLDWPHLAGHIADAAKVIFGDGDPCVELWRERACDLVWAGALDEMFAELEACRFLASGAGRDALVSLIRYLQTNRRRLTYRECRARALPIGSGAVESAHRHVLQRRMKLAGQHWDVMRGNRFAGLRALQATTGPAAVASTVAEIAARTAALRSYG